MKTDVGVDTGDIIYQREIDIKDNETCGELFERLSVLGANCIIEALPSIIDGTAKFVKQDDALATNTKIIRKDMAKIDWNDSADDICNKIRAFNPSPIAFTFYNNEPFKVYEAKSIDMTGEQGVVLSVDDELIIGCGKGAVSLLKVQKSGGKPMDIKDFLRGNKLVVGEVFA